MSMAVRYRIFKIHQANLKQAAIPAKAAEDSLLNSKLTFSLTSSWYL
jgi:hypothetical protein